VADFVFHLPGSVLRDPALLKPYYRRLIGGLRERGLAVECVVHDRALLPGQVAADQAFHIADHGSHRHPRLLNTGIAYVYPFWNLDPWGIRALSSIAEKPFDSGAVDAGAATAFAARLHRRLVQARQSRYDQPQARADLPRGSIAVFLQSESHRQTGETCHLTLRQMVKALMERDDPRAILIKPHPLDADPATARFLARMAAQDSRLRIVAANIHDMLAVADVAVTINSAVGIEAMLHGVPVVLCGQSDFHHCAVTVRTVAGMETAIASATGTDWPHAAYLYWYFALNCLNAGRDTLVDDFLEKVAATGFAVPR
jgi:hypothetical protein